MAGVKLCLVALALAACVSGGLSSCTESTCPGRETCCTTPEGKEGCCPYKGGICCLDGIHCCPSGTVCDEERRQCIDPLQEVNGQFAFLELAAATNASMPANVQCPDKSTCPDGSTCCIMSQGYGCCPVEGAVCCKDHIHCCPSGTHCIGGGLCYRPRTENDIEGAEEPQTRHAAIVKPARRGPGSECSDICPRNRTCCDLAGGGQGCCAYKDGICCIDGIHCCPFGTLCDTDRRRCINPLYEKKERITFVKLASPTPILKPANEHCPDGSTCPGASICCMTPTKHYGCCPFQHGVCCRDKIHCCPYGSYCIGGGLCQRQYGESFLKATRVQVNEQVDVTKGCIAGPQKCGTDQTCCEKSDGSAACCPLKDAVCCDGMDSCCPQGFVCSPFGCLKA